MARTLQSACRLSVLFLIILHGSPAGSQTKITVGVAAMSPRTVPLLVAQEQGLFAKNGIEARIVLIKGAPTLVASLISGEHRSWVYRRHGCRGRCCPRRLFKNSLVYLEQAHSYVDRKPEYQNGRKPAR